MQLIEKQNELEKAIKNENIKAQDFVENPLNVYNTLKGNSKKSDGASKKLLTRSGSDPKFDNVEYLKKIEQ